MNAFHEWPLVLFTLTVQFAVGLHLVLLSTGGPPGAGSPAERPTPWTQDPYLWVGGLMAGALTISLLHLGSPLGAFHSLANLETSWLSREILALLAFLGLWASGYWFGRRPGSAPRIARGLAWATALAGIGLIGIMARIYMIPARPLWDHWLTGASFLLTTLSLGAVAGAAYLEHLRRSETGPTAASPRTLSALAVAGLAASLAQAGATLAHPITKEVLDSRGWTSLAGVRLLLLVGGVALLWMALVRPPMPKATPHQERRPRQFALGALVLLGASEVVGRFLFYVLGPTSPF